MIIETTTLKPIVIPNFFEFNSKLLVVNNIKFNLVKAKITHVLYPMFELAFATQDGIKFYINKNTLDIDFDFIKEGSWIELITNENNVALRGNIEI